MPCRRYFLCVVSSSQLNHVIFFEIKGLLQNTTSNKLEIEIFHSDLFDNVPKIDFDYILINPPYYAHKISKDNPDEYAFYAGENLEYFTKLFDQLISRINSKTEVLFVLSENAALKTINIEADKRGFQLETIHTATKGGEIFFIQELNWYNLASLTYPK